MTLLVNRHNYPDWLAQAVTNDDYHNPAKYGVTSLLKPPRQFQLEKRHSDELVEDVSDRLWAFFGKMGHALMERIEADAIKEYRMVVNVSGVTVGGQLDFYHKTERCLWDFKFTSIWSVLGDLKKEWEAQTNIYKVLLEMKTDHRVEAINILAMLRDWSVTKAAFTRDYPRSQAQVVPVPVWHPDDTWGFLEQRVSLHEEAAQWDDFMLPDCTPEERWARPDTFAVMKKGRKTAVRVLESEQEAISYAMDKGLVETALEGDLIWKSGHYIEKRPGESPRCERYCSVQDFCNQYHETIKTVAPEEVSENAA